LPELETLSVGFGQLVKFNVADGTFDAVMTSERPDKANEVLDYTKSKPAIRKWSAEAQARSKGKSLGNIREMHDLKAAGVLTRITFDDKNKRVLISGRIVDPLAKSKVETGVYTGVSVGGSYAGDPLPDSTNPLIKRYVIGKLTELSLVDDPCNEDALLTLIGVDGAEKIVKLAPSTIEADVDADPVPAPAKPKEPDMPEPVKIDAANLAEALKAHFENEKKVKADAKAKKLEKWSKRAEAYKVDYAKLTKVEQKDFRLAYKVDQGLQKIARHRGIKVETPDAIVGPVDDANKKVDDADLTKRAPAKQQQPPAFAAAL